MDLEWMTWRDVPQGAMVVLGSALFQVTREYGDATERGSVMLRLPPDRSGTSAPPFAVGVAAGDVVQVLTPSLDECVAMLERTGIRVSPVVQA
jgi:hypothetical protein